MDDLISEFIHETTESLAVLDAELVKFERNPGDQEILGTIYRLVHTIKGTCGFLELARLESVAEAVEDVLADVHDSKISMEQTTSVVLLEALSSIRDIITHLAEFGHEPQGNDAALIARLKRVISNEVPIAVVTKQPAPAVQKAAPKLGPEKDFAESTVPQTLPPLAMNHPPLAAVASKREGEHFSEQTKQSAIRHGLEVESSAAVKAPLARGFIEKLAAVLSDLVRARNQIQGTQHAPDTSLVRLTSATQALKQVLSQAEEESAQPSAVQLMPVVIAYAAGERLALPQRYILEIIDLEQDRNARVQTISNTQVLVKGKRVAPLVKLRSLLKLSEFPSEREDKIAVMRVGEAEFGLVLERVGEPMEVVLEKLPKLLRPFAIYKGAALMQDDTLAMVLDAAGLARAIGFRHVRDIPLANDVAHGGKSQGFLVFRAGSGLPKALPLNQVLRVDEIEVSTSSIRIAALPGTVLPRHGAHEIVVLATDGDPIALAVDNVIDVLHAPYALNSDTQSSAYLGTLTIGGHAAELVDVGHFTRPQLQQVA